MSPFFASLAPQASSAASLLPLRLPCRLGLLAREEGRLNSLGQSHQVRLLELDAQFRPKGLRCELGQLLVQQAQLEVLDLWLALLLPLLSPFCFGRVDRCPRCLGLAGSLLLRVGFLDLEFLSDRLLRWIGQRFFDGSATDEYRSSHSLFLIERGNLLGTTLLPSHFWPCSLHPGHLLLLFI